MNKQEFRRLALKTLYEKFCEHPYHVVTPREFTEQFKVNRQELNFNMVYLERKGLVELDKPLEGDVFVAARITPKGIDLVEDDFALATAFPNEPLPEPGEIARVLKEMESVGKALPPADPGDEAPIADLVEQLTGELGKPQPSYRELNILLGSIRQRDRAVGDRIVTILRDPAIARRLADSAKRELLDS